MAKDPRKAKKRKVEEKEPEETNGEVMEVIESEAEEESAEESGESESEVDALTNQVLQSEVFHRQQLTQKPVYRDRFREYYMTMLTSEFGDDLDAIRKDNKFEEKRSLPVLIRSLEQGINIFSPEERKLILTQQ